MDKTINEIMAICHPIYFLLGISINILLYYLIFTKTTPIFKTMKWFLIPSNTSTMIVSLLTHFIQLRLVRNTNTLAVMGQGYCRDIGGKTCFHTYAALLAMSCLVGLLTAHTIFYRMVSVKTRDRRQIIQLTTLMCIMYWFPITVLILCEIPQFDIPTVYNATLTQHPDYHFEPYGEFGGFANTHDIFATSLTMLLVFMCITAPIFGYICKTIALKELDLNKTSLSQKTRHQVRTMIHGFTLQVILPLTCYVPVATTGGYAKFTGEEQFIISQYFIGTLTALPSVIDPLLTMYFIVPYRTALKQIVRYRTPSSSEVENDVKPAEIFQRSVGSRPSNCELNPIIGKPSFRFSEERFLAPMDETINKVLAIYYPVFLVFGVSLNILLYYLIITKTTPVFKTMKYFLIPSNTSTILLLLVTYFIQLRTVRNTKSMAILGQGYCKNIGGKACFHTYGVLWAMSSLVATLTGHTMFYRMICVKNQDRREIIRKTMLFSIYYSTPILCIVLCEMSDFNIPLVYNETLTEHPEYHLEPYGEFGGFADTHNFYPTSLTILLAVMAVYYPIFCFICRRIVLKQLYSNKSSLSEKTRRQVETFINGFTLQSILPLVCYFPVSITSSYRNYTGKEPIIIAQYFIGALVTFPSICDPLITMYFIVPYRNALKQFVKKIWMKSESESSREVESSKTEPTEMFTKVANRRADNSN